MSGCMDVVPELSMLPSNQLSCWAVVRMALPGLLGKLDMGRMQYMVPGD